MKLQKRAVKKIQREFQSFKRKTISSSSKAEVFEACAKIHFYSCIKEYFELNSRIPKGIFELALKQPGLIEAAWRMYLKSDKYGYQTWEEIDELLEDMLMGWKLPLAG